MIREAEIERYLDDWLGNAPMAPADRVVVAVAVRIARQKQRPAPRLAWAVSSFFASTRLLGGVAAALLVAVIALALAGSVLPRFGNVPTPAPISSPTPSPTGTPTASPSEEPPGITAALEGGLPSNWSVIASGLLSFYTEAEGRSMSIELLRNLSVMAESCAMGPEPGVGTSAEAFVAAIGSRPGLIATNLGPAEVGGLSGRQVDLRMEPSTTPPCPGDPGPSDDFVPLFGEMNGGLWRHVGVTRAEQYRLIVVDAPGGQNVVVAIVASDAQAFEEHIDDAIRIVSRLTFDIG